MIAEGDWLHTERNDQISQFIENNGNQVFHYQRNLQIWKWKKQK